VSEVGVSTSNRGFAHTPGSAGTFSPPRQNVRILGNVVDQLSSRPAATAQNARAAADEQLFRWRHIELFRSAIEERAAHPVAPSMAIEASELQNLGDDDSERRLNQDDTTCWGMSCEHWMKQIWLPQHFSYSCAQMESYGCDCSNCDLCSGDGDGSTEVSS
jgi:hypothetical protein